MKVSASRTAVLPVAIGEQDAVISDAVDVRRVIAHRAPIVGTDIEIADVVSPDDQDVGFVLSGSGICEEKR
jgi:hypothetical protein